MTSGWTEGDDGKMEERPADRKRGLVCENLKREKYSLILIKEFDYMWMLFSDTLLNYKYVDTKTMESKGLYDNVNKNRTL